MRLRNRITLVSAGPVFLALAAVFGTLFIHYRYLARSVDATFRAQAFQEAAKVARNTYLLCASAESRNQIALNQSLGVAHDLLTKAGGVMLGTETIGWHAVNQVTKQANAQTLPKMMLGDRWLGQVGGARETALVVDDVLRGTGSFCTIFQRMNEAGDMLRVTTSVLSVAGERAIGTYISARNPDGTNNPVLESVLRGTTYRGRAFVVNDWHAAAYEPLWDAGHTRVIGMLYVGVPLAVITKDLHDTILKMTVGKGGMCTSWARRVISAAAISFRRRASGMAKTSGRRRMRGAVFSSRA
jgi:methyl-accepting chemotaxis protein